VTDLADLIAVLERAYPPELAESWDAIGLVCGDPAQQVTKAHICVDPVDSIVDEAIDAGAQLIVAHHPLLLRGVHGVPANTPKGSVVHRLIRAGVALYCAHTNADAADPGVSDALSEALGVAVTGPLAPNPDGRTGVGRIGTLSAAEPLRSFTERVRTALPPTAWGVRAAGDPDRPIRTVAVCGGAGDAYLDDAVRAGVDAYVTADLRHHPASEHLEADGPALVDASHWATEWPWLANAAGRLTSALAARGITVEARVSDAVTDAWTATTTDLDPRAS
jgi:dinuclear metal center YbgI/SA1388 family protein